MANREQRRHPRIRRRFSVTLEVRGRLLTAVTVDLSSSGVLVQCGEILLPGTPMLGVLDLDGKPLKFGAVVRWSRSASRLNSNETQHSMGLSFLSGPGPAYAEYFARASEELGVSQPAAAKPTATKAKPAAVKSAVQRPAEVRSPTSPRPPSGTIPRVATPPPAPSAVPPEATRVAEEAPTSVPGLVPGLIGRAVANAISNNGKSRGASPYAPSEAAVLFERAAVQAVSAVLPSGTQTLGLSVKLSLNRPPNVMIGARLEAVATLLQISPDWTLRFQVELKEGERLVASGEHLRVLVAG